MVEVKKLRRSRSDRKIAGVCAGVGVYFGIDPTVVRVVWLLSILALGFGVLLYLICWAVLPQD